MRTIAEQTLYTCGWGANEFNFRCGFALCGAKKIFATPSTEIYAYKKENVQCYGNSCMQCFPCKKTLHRANVCFREHTYFKSE